MSDFLDRADDARKNAKENDDMTDSQQFSPGQRLTLAHDDGTVLVGTIDQEWGPLSAMIFHPTAAPKLELKLFLANGFRVTHTDGVPVPDAPQLPTEPGVYADADGDPWTLDDEGQWDAPRAAVMSPGDYLPFTRLDTEAAWRSKIAAEVGESLIDALGARGIDTKPGQSAVRNALDNVLRGFEVTDR